MSRRRVGPLIERLIHVHEFTFFSTFAEADGAADFAEFVRFQSV